MTQAYSLANHYLATAAGQPVDTKAYHRYAETSGSDALNMARVQCLARCYRAGWLDNVLRRITPLTMRNTADYLIMADLFVTNAAVADTLLAKMSADLSAFATAAGVMPGSSRGTLDAHLALYQSIAGLLERKFAITAPAPFASATVDATLISQMPFIRSFLAAKAA